MDGIIGGADVCLIVPPPAAVAMTTLGTAVLAAALRARDISARVIHANIAMAERMGFSAYLGLEQAAVRWMAAERAFREVAWPPEVLATMEAPLPLPERQQASFEATRVHAAAQVAETTAQVAALAPKIVGITSTFQQNLAALAIARSVRAALPDACIVIGGGNVAEPMGSALAEVAPWVDHFFSGEADIAFPDFCEALLRDGTRPAERVIACPPLWDMSLSPAPDYSDFFADLNAARARGTLPEAMQLELMLEFARGCWWGAKNHCTFCGLNGSTIAFREKPVERALAEIDATEAQWGVGRYWIADNILPIRYIKELLPQLAERENGPQLFYEVKSNLSEEQIALLARARVLRVQPGIESFSTHVLKLMRKGVSGHRNLMTLRDTMAHGVKAGWIFLYGFPGETPADYEATVRLIPAIEHLPPPDTCVRIMIDRFSPNFDHAEEYGIGALRPMPGYFGLYPPEARLNDIAYHFLGDYETDFTRDAGAVARLHAAFEQWQARWTNGAPELRVVRTMPGGTVILDTRAIARAKLTVIAPASDALLRRLQRPLARDQIEPALHAALDDLIDRGFVIVHEAMLLSVVIRPPAVPVAPEAAVAREAVPA